MEIDQLISGWPKTPQAQLIARQLFAAATSVGANIAEGKACYVGKEYERFLTPNP